MNYYLVTFLFALFINYSTNPTGEIEYINIKPPSEAFNSIPVPSFRGKPRMGLMNMAGVDNVQKSIKQGELNKAIGLYEKFLLLKTIDSVFDYLDLKKLTKYPGIGERNDPDYNRKLLSATTQKFLLDFGTQHCTESAIAKYFCKPMGCIKGMRPIEWAGTYPGDGEFERHEAYLRFVNDKMHTAIRKWGNEISREAYLVSYIDIKNYDFDKGGFPITINLKTGEDNSISYVPWDGSETASYTPPNEEHLKKNKHHVYQIDTLLTMSEIDARAFTKRLSEKRNNRLYTVLHIKFYEKKKVENNPYTSHTVPYLPFYIKTNKIEIFEDESLTQKIRELELKLQ